MDCHSRLPQRRSSNHVAAMDAGTRALYVFARTPGRNGHRQRSMGSAGDKDRYPEYNALFRNNFNSGLAYGPALSADGTRVGTCARRSQGLKSLVETKTTH